MMWYKNKKLLIALVALTIVVSGVEIAREIHTQRSFNELVQDSHRVLPNDPNKSCILGVVAMASDDSTGAEKRAAVDAYYDCVASTTPNVATATPLQVDPSYPTLRPIWILWAVISMTIAFGGGYVIGLLD